MKSTYKEIHATLIAAKALIENPANWIQGRLSNGSCSPGLSSFNAKDATCFCSYGALGRITNSLAHSNAALYVLDKSVPKDFPTKNAIVFNDRSTHAEVMVMWDRAIAKAAAYVVVDNLKAARAVIEKPGTWARFFLAADQNGAPTLTSDKAAVCFCSVGAVLRVMPDVINIRKTSEGEFLHSVALSRGASNVVSYNDGAAHAEVLSMFDEAIFNATVAAQAI